MSLGRLQGLLTVHSCLLSISEDIFRDFIYTFLQYSGITPNQSQSNQSRTVKKHLSNLFFVVLFTQGTLSSCSLSHKSAPITLLAAFAY